MASFNRPADEGHLLVTINGFEDMTALLLAEPGAQSTVDFRAILDALPVAIYTTDAQGHLTHFNPAAVALAGRTPQLDTDQWCVSWKLYYPDGTLMPHAACSMAIALNEGRVERGVEAILERPDGTRLWFEAYPTLLRERTGRIVGGLNLLVDITERKHAEAARAHLAAIVTSSDDAIISKSLQGIIRSWNQGAEKIFGYTAAEAVGQPITMLMPPQRVDEEPQILEKIKRGETIAHYETVRRRKDGTEIDISLTISPIRDNAGHIIGASKIARNITVRKQAEAEREHLLRALTAERAHLQVLTASLEQQVQERTAELTQRLRELDEFAYVTSHDLKAPLRAIDHLAHWISEDTADLLPLQSREHLTKLRGRITRMERLLDDLLAYSRAGRYAYSPEQVDVTQVMNDVLRLVTPPQGFAVSYPTPLPVVRTQKVPLETVLRNLISNAIKHHDRSDGQVAVAVQDLGEWLAFSVQDDGPGIAPEFHERIFEVFQTLKPHDQVEGSGMGLAIVKKLVESRGGTITVESCIGQGATFHFTWPKA